MTHPILSSSLSTTSSTTAKYDFAYLDGDGTTTKTNFKVVRADTDDSNGNENLPQKETVPVIAGQSSITNEYETEAQMKAFKRASDGPVGWLDLPRKGQLTILTIARLSEPLVQSSLQLKWFDSTLPDSTIAAQAGMLQASFTAAQFVTALPWGKASDSEWFGRKRVLMIGLFGTMLSCIGFGFATTFWQAMLFRTLGGFLNGNVGVMRTMISEIIVEKKYQSRAFLLLPMCFNIGVIVGPVLGGILADLGHTYPTVFGDVRFFQTYPYAAPNLLSAFFLFNGGVALFLGLDETLSSLQHKDDLGRRYGRKLVDCLQRCRRRPGGGREGYMKVEGEELFPNRDGADGDVEMHRPSSSSTTGSITNNVKSEAKKGLKRFQQTLPFRRIFTRNVICTFIAHGTLACHLGTFNSLWFVFLSTPVADPAHPRPPGFKQKLPFFFTGGLGMPAQHVGFAMAVLGVIGITLQLFLYPTVNARLGVVKSWRIFLSCFPTAYILAPFLATIPSSTPPPAEKDGVLLWLGLCGVLFVQVVGRTFALPATMILLNNCCPHPSVLGTVHGMGQSISSAARTVGPVLGGYLYGVGLDRGMVGSTWWGLSLIGVCGIVASQFVRDGDGHEIVLEGDDIAEAEFQANEAVTPFSKK